MSSGSDYETKKESNHTPESSLTCESNSTIDSKNDKESMSLTKPDNTINEKTSKTVYSSIFSNIQELLLSTKFIAYDVDLSEFNDIQEINDDCLLVPTYKHIYIRSISLPPNLQIIKEEAFHKCNYLEQITFIKNKENKNFLKFIGEKAFLNTKIQSIIIPDNITQIDSNCFPMTLKLVDFENGAPNLEKIGDKIFFISYLVLKRNNKDFF